MPRSKKTAPREQIVPPTRYEFETFHAFNSYDQSRLTRGEPSSFNGVVNVRKWRIVAEQVDEPAEVLIERVRKLWRECDNDHQWQPLRNAAASLGVVLDSDECGVGVVRTAR